MSWVQLHTTTNQALDRGEIASDFAAAKKTRGSPLKKDCRSGRNPTIAARILSAEFKNPWQILAKSNAERRSRSVVGSHFGENEFWRSLYDEVRTYFERDHMEK